MVLAPLPGNEKSKFAVRLRWPALPWQLPEPTHVEAVAEDAQVLSREPVCREGDAILLVCEPKAFCYRFVRQ